MMSNSSWSPAVVAAVPARTPTAQAVEVPEASSQE
jgi:hypothetical protein